MNYNYSIIIPHKNSPDLLERCMDSIPERKDLQVIIVDDDSSPEKVDFENFPGLKRADTTCIFDKSGKGAGHARNIGLSCAIGKWIVFSDADDFFSSNFNRILDEHLNSIADLTYFDIESVYSETLTPCKRSENYKDKLYKAILDSNMDLLRYKMTVPWGKIISRMLVCNNNITFDEIPVSNDAWFSLLVGYHAKKVEVSKEVLYINTENFNSLMHQNSSDKLWCRLKCAAKINEFLVEHKKEQYHVNLFAYEYYFWHTGIINILKSFVYSFKNTPVFFVCQDLWNCFVSLVIPSRRKLG